MKINMPVYILMYYYYLYVLPGATEVLVFILTLYLSNAPIRVVASDVSKRS